MALKLVNTRTTADVDEVYITFVNEEEHEEKGGWEHRQGWKAESRGPNFNNITHPVVTGMSDIEINRYISDLIEKGYVEF